MKKKSIFMVIIAAIVVVVIIVTVIVIKDDKKRLAENEKNNRTESETKTGISIEFCYYDDYWKDCDLTNAVYKTQTEYETAVRNYINQIAILLNKRDWYEQYEGIKTIYIGLKINDTDYIPNEEGLSFLKNSSKAALTCDLNMSNTMFQHNRSQLIQLLTQLVTKKVTNNKVDVRTNGLEEGFYWYIQNYLGMGTGSLNYGLDIHNYLIELTKKYQQDTTKYNIMSITTEHVGEISDYVVYPGTMSDYFFNNYWILCNYSFVDYMVKTYGIEDVTKMLDGYDESVYYLFNQNGLSGLLSDWKQFLEKYPTKMTGDEIDAYMTEFNRAHGY